MYLAAPYLSDSYKELKHPSHRSMDFDDLRYEMYQHICLYGDRAIGLCVRTGKAIASLDGKYVLCIGIMSDKKYVGLYNPNSIWPEVLQYDWPWKWAE